MQIIVLVEDDPGVRDTITWLLADEFPDCTVHAAATGLAFLALLQQQTPDLVLLDVRLPDVNGLFLYKLVRLQPGRKEVPVLFITANPDLVREARLSGSYGCLAKPFNVAELVANVQALLGRSGTPIKVGA